MTRLRNFSYSHDQDHIHIHSHAMLLHWKIASIYIHHKIKLQVIPWPPLSSKLPSRMWAIQKEIKDAYPKKICHMPTRYVKKRRKKDSPHPRKIKEKGWFMKRSSYTIHKKNIYITTHLHILIKVYDVFDLVT